LAKRLGSTDKKRKTVLTPIGLLMEGVTEAFRLRARHAGRHRPQDSYRTMSTRFCVWLAPCKLAVTVTVYVPGVVPDEPPPPEPEEQLARNNVSRTNAKLHAELAISARVQFRRRTAIKDQIANTARNSVTAQNSGCTRGPLLPSKNGVSRDFAVVPTVNVNIAAVVPES
jgi:hypothetical protein